MILKALYDYYNRRGDLPPVGFELKEIGFLIVIDKEGNFRRLESRMENNKTAKKFLVLRTVQRSSTKFVPNYLWDKYDYVIGGSDKNNKKRQTFIDMVDSLRTQLKQNEYLEAISGFYKKNNDVENALRNDTLFDSLCKSNKNISFLIQGYRRIAAEDEDITRTILSQKAEEHYGVCLITGNKGPIARMHSGIKLGQNTGPLVSLQSDKGYDSYGKEQGLNASVTEEAEFKYWAALQSMLSDGSRNKFQVGNRYFLFWASSNSEAAEKAEAGLFDLLVISEYKEDNPDANILMVRQVFDAIVKGDLRTELDDRFYILGLTPNKTRRAVVYWSETSLKDFASMILRHFDDMAIEPHKGARPYMGVWSMVSAVTLGGKPSDATPNLPESIVKSIFQGYPYPFTLFSSCIRRIRAESGEKNSVYAVRAAIIKAYLNRLNDNNKKIQTMLDKDYTNSGYLCGRLFAVLDKIQEEASNISSIRERYMNAASATPSAVFATILNLSVHHAEKLGAGRKVQFEKLKQEILAKLPADGFPAHLNLQDQGRFFVGYYHQRQDFFTKNEESNEQINVEQ